jgi:hypothetical protein
VGFGGRRGGGAGRKNDMTQLGSNKLRTLEFLGMRSAVVGR